MGNVVASSARFRRRSSVAPEESSRIIPHAPICSGKTDPVLDLLGDEFRTVPVTKVTHDSTAFLHNPFSEDAKKGYVTHTVTDDTDLATVPPGRFPVPRDAELPAEYPLWLGNYVNRKEVMKLKLEMSCTSMPPQYMQSLAEARHLRDNVRYLTLSYQHQVGEARPHIVLSEIHKGRRQNCLKIRKRRSLHPRIVVLKKTEKLVIIGKGFLLRLYPVPDNVDLEFFSPAENNGEVPVSLGTYTRALDTAPTMSLEWSVRLWDWENGRSL